MPNPDIEIVTHCWNYSRLLTQQLASLVMYPPKCRVRVTVAMSPKDDGDTVDAAARAAMRFQRVGVGMHMIGLPKGQLCRRAIGRNIAAQATSARIVWFTDCDYLFGPGCLDWLSENWPEDAILAYPRVVRKCPKEYGDKIIAGTLEDNPIRPRLAAFKPRKHGRAIGGIQIVSGDVAREKGYLPNHRRYQKPVDRWRKTNEDPAYRRSLGTSGTQMDIPEVYRIRHTQYGRKHVGVEL